MSVAGAALIRALAEELYRLGTDARGLWLAEEGSPEGDRLGRRIENIADALAEIADPGEPASDPGYIADFADRGERFAVLFPDGELRSVVVLDTYKSGAVKVDFVDRVAELRAEAGRD